MRALEIASGNVVGTRHMTTGGVNIEITIVLGRHVGKSFEEVSSMIAEREELGLNHNLALPIDVTSTVSLVDNKTE